MVVPPRRRDSHDSRAMMCWVPTHVPLGGHQHALGWPPKRSWVATQEGMGGHP